jgi:hypothetical protein
LALRQIDPTEDHVALISEWDTFFGRMQAMTLASQVYSLRHRVTSGDFIATFRTNGSCWPSNVSNFVYLRGLDGERSGDRPVESAAAGQAGSRSRQGLPLEQLRVRAGEANQAAGPAQFDYISRLGDRLQQLNRQLRREYRGELAAIGIVGSDVYDTLLILQALRPKFPNVVFFSTDLDARLWHPRELEWSRNLLVVSSYGLELSAGLQGGIAPFRDSSQTAQFAAALCAIGDTNMTGLRMAPRRFEIGAKGPVDLSVTSSALHPPTASQQNRDSLTRYHGLGFGMICAGLAGIGLIVWGPLRRLTVERQQYLAECLWLKKEDLGGSSGAAALLRELQEDDDPMSQWLHAEFRLWPGATGRKLDDRHADDKDAVDFIEFLNERLRHETFVPRAIARGSVLPGGVSEDYDDGVGTSNARAPFLLRRPLRRLEANRRLLDAFLERISKSALSKNHSAPAFDSVELSR